MERGTEQEIKKRTAVFDREVREEEARMPVSGSDV